MDAAFIIYIVNHFISTIEVPYLKFNEDGVFRKKNRIVTMNHDLKNV